MKPEDRARLDAAIEHAETIAGSTHNIYEMRWIRGIIDEQDAEIARLKTQSENQARIIDTQRRLAQCGESKFEAENETLKEQRAEERAKREAAENLFYRTHGVHHSWVAGYEQERERANRAERELAEERAAHAKADAARVNLRDKLDTLAAHSNGVADEVERWCAVAADWKGRAEKAEAALATEREGGPHNYVHKTMFASVQELRAKAEARVAELQALLDAATPIVGVSPLRIALARGLAAKEKEPK